MEPRPAAPAAWKSTVFENLVATDDLARCFAAHGVENDHSAELRLVSLPTAFTPLVYAADDDVCAAVACLDDAITKLVALAPLPGTAEALDVKLTYHPLAARPVVVEHAWLHGAAPPCACGDDFPQAPALPAEGRAIPRDPQLAEELSLIESTTPELSMGARVAWATWLNDVHDRVHPIFTEGFLGQFVLLPPAHQLNRDLSTTVGVGIDGKGALARFVIVESSGVEAFDRAVFASFERAAPFCPPRACMQSPDGLTYFTWRFHRDPRYACSTYFAAPRWLDSQ